MNEEEKQEEGQAKEEQVTLSKAEYEKMQADLEHLSNQDRNFKALRNKELGTLSEEEKNKILGDKIEEIHRTQEQSLQQQRNERIDDALDIFAGNDKEAREKFVFYFKNDRRSDEAITAKGIASLMKEYIPLVKGVNTMSNPINRVTSHYSPSSSFSDEKSFSESDEGKSFKKSLGLKSIMDSARSNPNLRVKGENE